MMKNISYFTTVFILLFTTSVLSQKTTMNAEHIKKLDASWEKAQLDLNFHYIDSLLSKEFIWVHNHANTIDDKAAVLNRIQRYLKDDSHNASTRASKNVKVIISGTTAIVTGNAIIVKKQSAITYHFMRTYVQDHGKIYLIANHTMAIPNKDE